MSTIPMRRCPAPVVATSLLASAALLTACGGGGSATPPPPPPAPATVSITGKAVDGALSGATACYDLNDNGACDGSEPVSAATGADGAFSLAVQPADVGKHRIVVQVPATAIDADTGAAVGTAYTLQAPATGTTTAHAVFVSPLTTLVQGHVDATGVTLAEATALVQTQAGLAVSPLADFTAASNADNKQAALLARLVQATTLAQADTLKTVAGQTDLSGGTASVAEVAKQVTSAVIGALPVIAGKAAESVITGATGKPLTDALASAAKEVVVQAGVTVDEAKANIGAAKLPADTSATTAVASAQLTMLRYTSAKDWIMRTLQSSAADNTPDTAGLLRYSSVFMQSQGNNYNTGAAVQAWAQGNTFARSGDLHWNGSAWVGCKLGDRYTATVRDAQGRGSYNVCDGLEKGRSARTVADLAGQTLASVFTKIRALPGGANGLAYANWGPASPAEAFGGATFPAGAKIYYQINTPSETAIAYDVQATAIISGFSAAVAAGGDTRSTAGLACAGTVTAENLATLEDLIARSPGKPCIFAKTTSGSDASTDPNESWGTSTASLAIVASAATQPAGTGNYYSTELSLRVAFAGGDSMATTYYGCLTRNNTGRSPRNCTVLGTGSYAIKTLGDARVMTFTGLPSQMQQAGYSRVFVERGGKVHYGYQLPAGNSSNLVRLNLEATNAVTAALPGLPAIVPATRYADLSTASQSALTTAKGVWVANDGENLVVLRIGDGGRYLFGLAGPDTGSSQTGHELGWLSYDAASQTFNGLVESNSAGEGGELRRSAAEQATEKLTISATQISSSLGTVFSRATNDDTGIVGLWAFSATDFNTQHFLFLPNGKLLMVDPLGDTQAGVCLNERKGPPGGEYSSYSFDKATGMLSVTGKLYDTNGCAGMFDIGTTANTTFTATVQLSSDGKTATVNAGDGAFTIYRVAIQ
ncbi:MAG TPA: hypothetical protein VIN58_14100 [Roseateles sp.]